MKKIKKIILKIALDGFLTPLLRRAGFEVRPLKLKGSIAYLKRHYGSKPLCGAEIGVWKGENALLLIKHLKIKKLYLIDPWEDYDEYRTMSRGEYRKESKGANGEKAYRYVVKKFKPFGARVEIIRLTSEQAITKMPLLDFAYIDGNHSYPYVKKDLELYWEKIKKPGVLMGDDFEIKDVAKAVFEFTDHQEIQFQTYYSGSGDNDFIIPK